MKLAFWRKAPGHGLPAKAGTPNLGGYFNRSTNAGRLIKDMMRWRDQLNPLRGLTIGRAIQYLEAGERGEYADLMWLYRFIEKRNPTLSALLSRFEGAMLSMEPKFEMVEEAKMPKAANRTLAEEQAAALREAYDGIDNIREAINFLLLARFRGFSHLEKWVNADGDITHLEPIDQWYWVREGHNGEWQYNAEARSGTYRGQELTAEQKANLLIREWHRPINEIALPESVYRGLGMKDWAGFVETYGIPPLFLIQPPNVDPAKALEYQAIAEAIIADARGSLPNGSDVKTVESGARSQNPFKEFLDFHKEELVLAGTGGKLTMLTESGSGTLAGHAHKDAWEEIGAGEAKLLSEFFQRSIDQPFLEENFPGQPCLAYFELRKGGEEEETKKFKRDVWMGFLQDKTVADVMANLISMRELTSSVDLPVNDEYEEPYLPVTDEQGRPVTGDVVRDAQGDVVGGDSDGQEVNQSGSDQQNEGGAQGTARPTSASDGGRPTSRLRITPYGNRGPAPVSPKLIEATKVDLAKATAADLQPVLRRLAAIVQIEDPEIFKNRLTVFLADLERLKIDIGRDPESARVLQEAMSAALANGLTSQKATKPTKSTKE